MDTYKTHGNEIYMLLPIESLTTIKFMNLTKDCGFKLFIPSGRIKFENGIGCDKKAPAFGTIIIRLQDEMEIEIIDKTKLGC